MGDKSRNKWHSANQSVRGVTETTVSESVYWGERESKDIVVERRIYVQYTAGWLSRLVQRV